MAPGRAGHYDDEGLHTGHAGDYPDDGEGKSDSELMPAGRDARTGGAGGGPGTRLGLGRTPAAAHWQNRGAGTRLRPQDEDPCSISYGTAATRTGYSCPPVRSQCAGDQQWPGRINIRVMMITRRRAG